MKKLFVIIYVVLVALAGCASTGQYQTERLPEIVSAGDVSVTQTGLETTVRMGWDCEGNSQVWAEFKTDNGGMLKSFQAECRAANVQKVSIVGIKPGMEGELKVLAENSRGKVSRKYEAKIKTLPTPPAGDRTSRAEDRFESKEACATAVKTGEYRYYEPKYFGLKNKNPVDGKTRRVVQMESDGCVEMLTVSGRKWVVQKEGTTLRWNTTVDGDLKEPYARDDCGNAVYAIFYPSPASPPAKEGTNSPSPAPSVEKTEKEIMTAKWSSQETEIVYDRPVGQQASSGFCRGGWSIVCGVAAIAILSNMGGGAEAGAQAPSGWGTVLNTH